MPELTFKEIVEIMNSKTPMNGVSAKFAERVSLILEKEKINEAKQRVIEAEQELLDAQLKLEGLLCNA